MNISLADEDATRALAAALGQALREAAPWGERHFCIGLAGDLGAGKTTLADALARALGVADGAQSPTYALVHRYDAPDLSISIWHLDLYRTAGAEDLPELGLDQYEGAGNLWLVEWIDLAQGHMDSDLHIHLEYDGARRTAHLQASDKESKIILQALQEKMSQVSQ